MIKQGKSHDLPDSGAQITPCPKGAEETFPGVKRPVREAHHYLQQVKNEWSFTSTTPYVFMMWCLSSNLMFAFTSL